MTPIWKKEPKTYEFRWALKEEPGALSGILAFYREKEYIGHTQVRFKPSFIRAVGRHLPFGISRFNPAHLILIHTDKYRLYCKYLRQDDMVLLWEMEERPKWCRGIKR